MKKIEIILETEKSKALRCKSLSKYKDKIKNNMKISYEDTLGNIVYLTEINNIQIKAFTYTRHQGAVVLSVKDMNTGEELSEAPLRPPFNAPENLKATFLTPLELRSVTISVASSNVVNGFV